MSKTIRVILVLFFLLPFLSMSQANATIAKIEFQLAEEAYEKKQYAEVREHIKKVEELLKQQNPKTRYLDILAYTEILNIKNIDFGNTLKTIQSQIDQINLYIGETNAFVNKYANIVPEEKIKQVYQFYISAKKNAEQGQSLIIKLNNRKNEIRQQYDSYTIDTNIPYETYFTEKVNMLTDKFRPGQSFTEALRNIDNPKPSELKSKMLSVMNSIKPSANKQAPKQQDEQSLSAVYRDFLLEFNRKAPEPFKFPITNFISSANKTMDTYVYKNIPLTYSRVRSTNLSTLKFNREVHLDKFKLDPSVHQVFVDEDDIIAAVYLSFPYAINVEREFISWMGKNSDYSRRTKHTMNKENIVNNDNIYEWFYNDLTITFGYTEYHVSNRKIPTSYVLITNNNKKSSKLPQWDSFILDSKTYYIELN